MLSVLFASAVALASAPAPAVVVARPAAPAVAVVGVQDLSRGGTPDDGDLWRRSLTVEHNIGRPATYTRVVVSNTPIPDSPENRARFGEPVSHGGRATAPRPGPEMRRDRL